MCKMFSFTKGSNSFIYFIGAFIRRNQRLIITKKPFAFSENYISQIRLYGIIQSKVNKTNFLITSCQSWLPVVRNKSKSKRISHKKRVEYESSDDDDDDDDDEDDINDDDDEKGELEGDSDFVGKDVEMVTRSLKSMRIDLVLKSILNINRKKVEDSFYQNKIRINGKVLYKKSQNAKMGDQIDMVYGFDNFQLNTLKIGRVKIVKAEEDPDNDRIILKVLRYKSLIIDNNCYEDEWREAIKQE